MQEDKVESHKGYYYKSIEKKQVNHYLTCCPLCKVLNLFSEKIHEIVNYFFNEL